MIRRRNFTPSARRRLADLDNKDGLGASVWEAQAAVATNRLAIVDQQSPAWRSLLNDYPHSIVVEVYARCGDDPVRARNIIEHRLGKPI